MNPTTGLRCAILGLLTVVVVGWGCRDREFVDLAPLPDPSKLKVSKIVGAELERLSRHIVVADDDPSLSRSELGERWGALGMAYLAFELPGTAYGCLENAASLAPGDHRWHFYLGQVLVVLDQPVQAVAEFERAVAAAPEMAHLRFSLGRALADAGREDEAELELREVVRLDETFAAAHLRLGEMASERGDLKEAAAEFERVLELQPGATRVHGLIAAVLRRLGDEVRAQEHLSQQGDGKVSIAAPLLEQLQSLERGTGTLINRGMSASEAGDLRAARGWFEKALEVEPENALARLNLGVTLVGLGHLEDARRELEVATELAPDNSRIHFNLGTVLAAEGRTNDAISAYRAATRIDPDYTAAHFNLANALVRNGDYSGAVDFYRTVIGDQPSNGRARLGEIIALGLEGREREALAAVEAGLEVLAQDSGLWQAKARLLATSSAADLRDGAQAHEIARRLLELRRELAHVETLAMALAEVGDFEGAVRWQRAALDAVRSSGRDELIPGIEANLESYESGLPCRRAWDPSGF